ncbi:MAG: hypothetical protein LBD14_05315, partial [Puniceicoccales bacterium]|nr:hypothetical protein [Puniceicoccales bacterium]
MRPSFIQALLFLTATAAALHSAPATPPPAHPKPTLTDATAEHLGELSKHLEHDDHTALLLLLEKILPTVPPDSFDRALLTQLQGQVLLNAKRYTDAIPALEISRQLSTGKNWFDPATTRQLHHTLSQLYYQEATQTTDTPTRRAKLRLATQRINEALALSQETRPDDHLYAATLLYTEATLDPAKPDPATL